MKRTVPFRRIGPGNVVLFLTALVLVIIVGTHLRSAGRDADLKACRRANTVRIEVNRRAPAHEADKAALLHLAATLAQTRKLEARVFGQFERQADVQIRQLAADPATAKFVAQARESKALIHKLRLRYEKAQGLDRQIAAQERTVTFRPTPPVNCEKAVP